MTPERIIKIISAVLSVFFFYTSYKILELIYPISFKSFEDIFFLMIIIILAITIVLFYKRKKAGWLMLVVCSCYFSISAIDVLIYYVEIYWSSLITHILLLVFSVIIIGIISRNKIRSVYSISGKVAISTILVATIVSLAYFYNDLTELEFKDPEVFYNPETGLDEYG